MRRMPLPYSSKPTRPGHAVQRIENATHLRLAEHHGQANRRVRSEHVAQTNQWPVHDVPMQELERRERLGLRRGRQLPIHSEIREERQHLALPHVARMPQALVPHNAVRPLNVRLLGAPAEMPKAQFRSQRMQQFRIGLQRCRRWRRLHYRHVRRGRGSTSIAGRSVPKHHARYLAPAPQA